MMEGLDLEYAGRVRKSKQLEVVLSRTQMLQIADRTPQAMLKVTSYAKGITQAMNTAKYISRDGDIGLETEHGDTLDDVEEIRDVINEWSYDFGHRKNSRDAVHIVLSAPQNSNREAVRSVVRDFARDTFSDNYSYLFAMHDDTKNPHGHLIVKMQGHDGRKLDPRKHDLTRWREVFAEKCNSQGIHVAASPRLARGVGTKGGKNGNRLAGIKAIARGEDSYFKQAISNDIAKAVDEFNRTGSIRLKTWEKSAKEKTIAFKESYKKESMKMKSEAVEASSEKSQQLLKDAKKLEHFADRLQLPKSLREQAIEYVLPSKEKGHEIDDIEITT